MERQSMAVDIACVGFGPAMAGFLTTLSRRLAAPGPGAARERRLARAAAAGGVLRARRRPRLRRVRGRDARARHPGRLPGPRRLADPDGDAGRGRRRSSTSSIRSAPRAARRRCARPTRRSARRASPCASRSTRSSCPYTPAFLHKQDGFVFSMGQLMQWMSGQVLSTGTVQIWPATPVASALVEGRAVKGVRLVDQGVDRHGNPEGAFMPGMDVTAALTVVGDGPVGAVGRQLDRELGLPAGSHGRRDWAVGMKFVVDLPEGTPLQPGTVLHTLGFPEPEIFGFLYVHPDRVASVGIFVPSWFESPVRTTYRYLQHYVQHPYLWRFLNDAKLRSWGAKSILESGRRGEPVLAGDGFARIGEGSGSTNVLTSSGVDEAFTTGVQLARGRHRAPRGGQAAHEGEPRRRLRRAAARELRRGGGARRREGARRVPAGRRDRAPRDGARRRDEREALARRRARPPRRRRWTRSRASTPGRSRPRRSRRSARSARRRGSRSTTRSWTAPAGRRCRSTASSSSRTRTRCSSAARCRRRPATRTTSTFLRPELCRTCEPQGLLRDLLGGGDPAGRGRGPQLRPREVRPLRRLPVELHAAGGRHRRGEPPAPRRHGRAPLRGELMSSPVDLDVDLDLDLDWTDLDSTR